MTITALNNDGSERVVGETWGAHEVFTRRHKYAWNCPDRAGSFVSHLDTYGKPLKTQADARHELMAMDLERVV